MSLDLKDKDQLWSPANLNLFSTMLDHSNQFWDVWRTVGIGLGLLGKIESCHGKRDGVYKIGVSRGNGRRRSDALREYHRQRRLERCSLAPHQSRHLGMFFHEDLRPRSRGFRRRYSMQMICRQNSRRISFTLIRT